MTSSVVSARIVVKPIRLTAAELVAPIVAVEDAVAFVRLGDALPVVGAFELRRRACDWRAADFVLVVETVVVTVADPRLRYAMARSWAGELQK